MEGCILAKSCQFFLFVVFHLNLAYSSIEEEQRPEIIRCCYWPMLRLARQYNLPFGIEISGYTLEAIAEIDPAWIEELRQLTAEGLCEFIGSGYAQLIGPLVPAEVNTANLRLGHEVYERLLGLRPEIALVNEQAYSAGMVQHYLDADYRAIIMEWDNPYRYHPEWNPEWRYLPQIACDQHGGKIPLIWNKSIGFQKFQRYAHNDLDLNEYLDYLREHQVDTPRVFPLYGNDIEVFDFRPGRYHTEAALQEEGEWKRIKLLFEALSTHKRFQFIRPMDVLKLIGESGAGNALHLESPESPIPVKKQGKYNITRWAVTGRDDLGINTACWRIYKAFKTNPAINDVDWRELCYLWSSDFRTHITEKRWTNYQQRLAAFERKMVVGGVQDIDSATSSSIGNNSLTSRINTKCEGNDHRYLLIETQTVSIRLNCYRGMSIDKLWFKDISDQPLVGTLPHGYYHDISMGADFYSGHLVIESPGQSKVTDLNLVTPEIDNKEDYISINGTVLTPLGPIYKQISVFKKLPRIKICYKLDWETIPIGSLRLGHITLNPAVFERNTLFYSACNGGYEPDVFHVNNKDIDHGCPVSFLVSASQGIGMTNGIVGIGDARYQLLVEAEKTLAASIGFITYRQVGDTYFYRLALSAKEIDETSRKETVAGKPFSCSFFLTGTLSS